MSRQSQTKVARSFEAWWKGEWSGSTTVITAEVVILGIDPDSAAVQSIKDNKDVIQSGFITRALSYEAWIRSEDGEKKSSVLRVCVMAEPGRSTAIMEQAYRKAGELDMPVMIVWPGRKSKYLIHLSVNPSDIDLLFNGSICSNIASNLVNQSMMIRFGKLDERVGSSLIDAINLLLSTKSNSEIADFYQICGLDFINGWRCCDVSLLGSHKTNSIPFIHQFLGVIILFDFNLMISPDYKSILFYKKQKDKISDDNGYLMDLSGGDVVSYQVRRAQDEKEEDDDGTLVICYQTEDEKEFMIKTNNHNIKSVVSDPKVLCMPSLSFSTYREAIKNYFSETELFMNESKVLIEDLPQCFHQSIPLSLIDDESKPVMPVPVDTSFAAEFCTLISERVWRSGAMMPSDELDWEKSIAIESTINAEMKELQSEDNNGDDDGSSNALQKEFAKIISKEPDCWRQLCNFQVKKKKPSSLMINNNIRQDQIENGPLPDMSESEAGGSESDYITKLLITAQFVNPHFVKLMSDVLFKQSKLLPNKVQFAQVKQSTKLEAESKDLAAKGDAKWPYSAGVIDLICCSVTINSLSQMMDVCTKFETFVESEPLMTMIQCKNGFRDYLGRSKDPDKYADICFNVSCKSEDGSRAVIGEVRLLLDSLFRAKLKSHEFCEYMYGKVPLPNLFDEMVDQMKGDQRIDHWTSLLDEYRPNSFNDILKAYQRGLVTLGMSPNRGGFDAKKWAIKSGNSELIRAAMAYEKSQKSSSSMEESMAESYHRWAKQSDHFVKEYILKTNGKIKGEECLKVLSSALIDFIKNRGDFTAVDLMGIVWHSSEESKNLLLKRLMMALENTLDYNTVHTDKIGWCWVRDVVMKHPLWMSIDEDNADSKEEKEEDGEDDDDDEDEDDDKDSDSDDKPIPILFERMKAIADQQASENGGNEIETAFKKLVKDEPDDWPLLCKYKPKNPKMVLRQDEIEHGPKSDLTNDEALNITMEVNSLDFNVRKMYDSREYMTKMLIYAQLVNPHFTALMTAFFSSLGLLKKSQFAPVKLASRVEPKSEEYASEGGRKWPYSACVIDLVRCSVTIDTLSEMLHVCQEFENYIDRCSAMSILRCKNGFKYYIDEGLPKQYTDIKYNVSCESEDGSRAIIGEVQVLLDCVLQAKLKAHELYEVSRSLPLYKGAAQRVNDEFSFNQQLLLTGGSEKLLIKPLTLYPFLFNVNDFDLSLLLKADLSNAGLIGHLSKAIVLRSHRGTENKIIPAFFAHFSRFDEYAPPFRYGSGRLICSIVELIPDRSVVDVYKLIVFAMQKKRLSMYQCFHLFNGLDRDVKSQLICDATVSYFGTRLPPPGYRSIASLVRFFDGFKEVRHSLSFMNRTSPLEWFEFDESNLSAIQDAIRLFNDKVNDPNPNIERSSKWIPILAGMEDDEFAVNLVKSSKSLKESETEQSALKKRKEEEYQQIRDLFPELFQMKQQKKKELVPRSPRKKPRITRTASETKRMQENFPEMISDSESDPKRKDSSSSGFDSTSEDESDDGSSTLTTLLKRFEKLAATGQLFRKYTGLRRRKPQDRIVKVEFDEEGNPTQIMWGSGSRNIQFSDILYIAHGHWTRVFEAHKDHSDPELCLSVVGQSLILDLEAPSKKVALVWVKGLRRLIGQTDEQAERMSEENYEMLVNGGSLRSGDPSLLDSTEKDSKKRAKSLMLLQQDLFVMTTTTVFRNLEEERIWDIDQSVRDRFEPKALYEEALREDIPWRNWNHWIRDKIVTYLRENDRISTLHSSEMDPPMSGYGPTSFASYSAGIRDPTFTSPIISSSLGSETGSVPVMSSSSPMFVSSKVDSTELTELEKKMDTMMSELETSDDSKDHKKRAKSLMLLQQDLFVMTTTTVFRELEEERIWDIDQSVRDRFNAKMLYEEALREDIPWRNWKTWIREQIVTYLREVSGRSMNPSSSMSGFTSSMVPYSGGPMMSSLSVSSKVDFSREKRLEREMDKLMSKLKTGDGIGEREDARALSSLQKELFEEVFKNIMVAFEENEVWIVDQSVRDRFNADDLYEQCLREDIPRKQWKNWITQQIQPYLGQSMVMPVSSYGGASYYGGGSSMMSAGMGYSSADPRIGGYAMPTGMDSRMGYSQSYYQSSYTPGSYHGGSGPSGEVGKGCLVM